MSTVREVESADFHKRMQQVHAVPHLALSSPDGAIRLAHSDFAPFKGEYEAAPYLTLHMCTAHIGRMRRVGGGQEIEGILRPGTVGIALPNSPAEGYWPRMQMLAIGVDLNALVGDEGKALFNVEDFHSSASLLHNDPLLTSVMTAMWRDAEAHGLSSPFFEHGLMLLLERLTKSKPLLASARVTRPLTGDRLTRILDLMEDRISTNVQLLELAQAVDQDKSSFSRSFRDATGFAPYEYFTLRRMGRAEQLLRAGETVTSVALNVGYTNPSKFSAAFRKIYGSTPSAWKRSFF